MFVVTTYKTPYLKKANEQFFAVEILAGHTSEPNGTQHGQLKIRKSDVLFESSFQKPKNHAITKDISHKNACMNPMFAADVPNVWQTNKPLNCPFPFVVFYLFVLIHRPKSQSCSNNYPQNPSNAWWWFMAPTKKQKKLPTTSNIYIYIPKNKRKLPKSTEKPPFSWPNNAPTFAPTFGASRQQLQSHWGHRGRRKLRHQGEDFSDCVLPWCY